VILRSAYDAAARTVALEMHTDGRLAAGWRLAFTSVVQLDPGPGARLVERLATYHVLEPDPPAPLAAGDLWRLGECTVGHEPAHADDGPVSAYVVLADGATATLVVEPMTVSEPPVAVAPGRADVPEVAVADAGPALVPMPRHLEHGVQPLGVDSLRLGDAPPEAGLAWAAVADLAERATGRRRLGDSGAPVAAVLDSELGAPGDEAYRIVSDGGHITVTATGRLGFVRAFVTLAQWMGTGMPADARVDDHPAYGWRGLHIDLARQWFEPDVVGRLIDLAAWRKLSRLHLHLTDDEGWRLPVAGHPELGTVVAARRGHALPLPPMLGGGPDPVGRAYTPDEIAAWVRRADDLGVTLVPEIDLPGHAHAALTALPQLRDPHDDSGAASVQFFTDNVLVPGLPATDGFLDSVLTSVCELFPGSPWIHIGGDEVPEGAWRGSPVVRRAFPGHTTAQVEAAFHSRVVSRLRDVHGRSVAAWQEAAECGGVAPGGGVVMCWRTVEASRQLAAQGHTVVVTPGQAYYLDMAVDDRWHTPGASWAGSTSLDDVVAFDPGAGWAPDERRHLAGVHACLWTEHVPDEATIHARLGRRLDAIAERGWHGDVVGGARSLAHRGATTAYLPPAG
jgi:hexosaminidase